MNMDGRVKLSQAAKILGMSFRQAQRHSYEGKIPTIISETGRRFVPVSWLRGQIGEAPNVCSRCAIYSRESSSENKAALLSQTDGLRRYAQAKGWTLVYVVEEFGSGVNDQRKKLRRLLERKDFDVLLVEHKDRRGVVHDRDENAAQNLEQLGTACPEVTPVEMEALVVVSTTTKLPSLKQELYRAHKCAQER